MQNLIGADSKTDKLLKFLNFTVYSNALYMKIESCGFYLFYKINLKMSSFSSSTRGNWEIITFRYQNWWK
jgi:hypothetical protein